MGKRYYWLKLKKDFFKRHDIKIIESMPNGKDYVLFYLKLLLESIDHEGNLRFSDTIPYNEQMLATVTDTNVDIVKSALNLFRELGLVEIFDDQTLYMVEVNNMLGTSSEWTDKKRAYNRRKSLNGVTQDDLPASYPYKLGKCTVTSSEMIQSPAGVAHYVDEKRYGGNGKIVFARDNGECQVCGATEKLVIHHKNGYSNEPEDLVVLCAKCHGEAHSEENTRKIPSNVLPNSYKSKSKSKNIELDKEIESDKEKEKDIKESDTKVSPKKTKTFHPPTVDEVIEYCTERNNHVDAERFVDFYESKGWMVGKNKMKNWKAAIRTWERNKSEGTTNGNNPNKNKQSQLDYLLNSIREDEMNDGN